MKRPHGMTNRQFAARQRVLNLAMASIGLFSVLASLVAFLATH